MKNAQSENPSNPDVSLNYEEEMTHFTKKFFTDVSSSPLAISWPRAISNVILEQLRYWLTFKFWRWLFSSRFCGYEDQQPWLRRSTLIKLKCAYIKKAVFHSTSLEKNYQEMLAELEGGNKPTWVKKPIMTVEPDEVFSVFSEMVKGKRAPEPFVSRGYFDSAPAVKKWNKDYFIDRFGDEKQYMMNSTSQSLGSLPLRSVEDGFYLSHSTNLWSKYPDLVEDLEQKNIDKLASENGLTHTFNELFFATKKKTGSLLHHANIHNFFAMISGEKQWTVINPEYTPLLYPLNNTNGFYAFNAASYMYGPERTPDFFNISEEEYRQKLPLVKYAPITQFVVRAGDLLYNPPYWWHCVNNMSTVSIAATMKYTTIKSNSPIGNDHRHMPLYSLYGSSPMNVIFRAAIIRHGLKMGFDDGDFGGPDVMVHSLYNKRSEEIYFERR